MELYGLFCKKKFNFDYKYNYMIHKFIKNKNVGIYISYNINLKTEGYFIFNQL